MFVIKFSGVSDLQGSKYPFLIFAGHHYNSAMLPGSL